MDKAKIFDRLIAVTAVVFVISGAYCLYEHNFMNLKQKQLDREHVRYMKDIVTDTASYREVMDSCLKQDRKGLLKIGQVAVPALAVNIPVYNKPYDEKALDSGAQKMAPIENNRIKGGNVNNTVLVGHNYGDGRRMFSPFQDGVNQSGDYFKNGRPVKNRWLDGRQVYLATRTGIDVYTIKWQKAVRDNDLSARKETSEKVITLVTCLEPDDDYRIVTRAELSAQCPWQSTSEKVLQMMRGKQQ